MPVVYPINLPSTPKPRFVEWAPFSVVATSASPFSLRHQIQVHPGQLWQVRFELPTMNEADAGRWISTLLSLNGRQGTFFFGDPVRQTPHGSALGSPVVDGAGQSGQSVITSGWTPDTNGLLTGGVDFIQLGGIERGTEGVFSAVPDWPTDIYIAALESNTITVGFSVTAPDGGGALHWSAGSTFGEKFVPAGSTAVIITHGLALNVPPARLYKVLNDVNSDASGFATINIWPRLRESPGDGEPVQLQNARGTFRLIDNEMRYDVNYTRRYGMQIDAIEAF